MMNETDLEAFGYYNANEEGYKPQMTPLEMVKQYHKTAGIDWDVDCSKGNNHDLFCLRTNLISEEYEEVMGELYEAVNFPDTFDPTLLLKELADLVYVVYGAAVTFGWDLDEALRRVHDNNMGRMYQPDGTIKRREDGKIEKNKDYPKVDLSTLV